MNDHCRSISKALHSSPDYLTLSSLLSMKKVMLNVRLQKELSESTLSSLVSAVSCIPDDNWRELSLNHLRSLKAAVSAQDPFPFQLDMVQGFLRDIFVKGDRRMLPVVYTMSADLWDTSRATLDAQEEATRTINKAFTLCITDRAQLPVSRKHGCYRLLWLLMSIYFKRNQLTLCTQLLRAVHTADMPKLTEYPRAHQAAFHYYHGRFLLSCGKFDEALEQFRRAMRTTLSSALAGSRAGARNVERIKIYYIPAHIACNPHKGPKPSNCGDIPVFTELFGHMAKGDVYSFRQGLRAHFHWLAKHDLYTLFERFDIIAVRNAVKRVHDGFGPETAARTKLPLQVIYNLSRGESVWQFGVDNMVAHFSSLISLGAIRGYVSTDPPYLVLSGKEPFPPFHL
jgi:hypothetical protein